MSETVSAQILKANARCSISNIADINLTFLNDNAIAVTKLSSNSSFLNANNPHSNSQMPMPMQIQSPQLPLTSLTMLLQLLVPMVDQKFTTRLPLQISLLPLALNVSFFHKYCPLVLSKKNSETIQEINQTKTQHQYYKENSEERYSPCLDIKNSFACTSQNESRRILNHLLYRVIYTFRQLFFCFIQENVFTDISWFCFILRRRRVN